ncbi:hypothetical protein T492DRAFT_1109598 [Pavlovales sp. CCMP2436]|nr:hypothetical protein T492DRAFT_1109598 [Pavlovales sp. CCMP2436]
MGGSEARPPPNQEALQEERVSTRRLPFSTDGAPPPDVVRVSGVEVEPVLSSSSLTPPSAPLLSRLVNWQAFIQKHLRPAARFPVLRSPHSWYETWDAKIGLDALLHNLDKGLPELSASPAANGFVYTLDRVYVEAQRQSGERRANLRILCFTKLRWLDILFLQVRETPDGEGAVRCTCSVRYFSTGLFPLATPGAPLLNSLLFLAPFAHNGLPSSKTLPDIRGAMQCTVEVTGSSGLLI